MLGSLGNNPSLEITHSQAAKIEESAELTSGVFSALMTQDLYIADSSRLPRNEAYEHSLSVSLFCYQCLAGKARPMRDNFSPNFSL